MTAPTFNAQSAATSAVAATATTAQIALPTHQADDIVIISAVNWAPATAGDLAAMTIDQGYAALGTTVNIGTTPNIDGTIQNFWKRVTGAGTTAPIVTRTGDTGADTGFQTRSYIIRGCIQSGNPWDDVQVSAALTGANGTIPACTVSGSERLVIALFNCTDDQSPGVDPSGWTSEARATTGTGTDVQFQLYHKDNQSSNSSAIASNVVAPVQGAYSFTVISFKPVVVVAGVEDNSFFFAM